jgi:site-specific recombinase XerD
MPALSTWNLDQTRLLTRRELAAVLADLGRRAARSANVHRNLVIVRLACCCGLRVSEIANLQLDDVVVDCHSSAFAFAARDHKGRELAARPALVGWFHLGGSGSVEKASG